MPDYTSSPYYQTAITAANTYGVPSNLFVAQIGQESQFNPLAQNGNALGIAQFMPATAQQFGINPYDPNASLFAAAAYDAQLYKQTGSWASALQSYGTTAGGVAPDVANLAQEIDASAGGSSFGADVLYGALSPFGITQQGVNAAGSVVSGAAGFLAFLATPSRWLSVLLGLIVIFAGLYLLNSDKIAGALEKGAKALAVA